MKLLINDVFQWRDRRWRLISLDLGARSAWIIDLEDRHAWPVRVGVPTLADCEREIRPAVPAPPHQSEASLRKLEEDYARLQLLLVAGADLLEKSQRKAIIARVSDAAGCCRKTLEKALRRYWQRGMTKEALLPDYKNCGRRQGGVTGGRGRRPRRQYDIYQVTSNDHARFEAAIKAYLADRRLSLTAAYAEKLLPQYAYEDGNGQKILVPAGSRPTLRQFLYYFKKKYGVEFRIEKRIGKKEYDKERRPKLSDTIADCSGIGHRYELDATIGDVNIVHAVDPATIVGKVTVYFIVDRKSRLIVGFYVGLENPCWETAVEAIVSLTESKEELCERYGVEYDPADWPADGILPSEILADNAEAVSGYSAELPRRLSVAISNTPSLAPHRKPNVETRFKLITADIRNIAPGYEPPEDRFKRRRKHYEKEACLTLYEFTREILEAVIKHNRTPIRDYPRTPDQIMRGVEPSPIALWNDEMRQRGCLGRRFDPEMVRLALLPEATAKITHEGLLFKKLYYVSDDPRLQRAFARARDGRSAVKVSYDRRLADCIYVHLPDGVVPARLSDRSQEYRGFSFREVELVHDEDHQQSLAFEQTRYQVSLDSSERRKPSIRAAEHRRDALGPLSVNERTASTVVARQDERRKERIARAERLMAQSHPAQLPAPTPTNVAGLPVQNRMNNASEAVTNPAQLVRKRMSK